MSWSLLLQMGGNGFSYGFMVPFFGLLVVGAILFVLWGLIDSSSTGASSETDDAMETLRQRYASGEIDDEEFEKQARMLRER